MLLRLVTALSLLASSFAAIKDCDTSSIFRPTQLALTPDPPIPGKPVRLTLIFDNTGPEVIDGTVTTSLSVNYIPVSPSSGPLCENTACPIVVGSNDRSTETIFPSVTGLIHSKVTWTNKSGQTLLCIDTSFKVANAFNPFNLLDDLFERVTLRGSKHRLEVEGGGGKEGAEAEGYES
jgi:hypothetical protein